MPNWNEVLTEIQGQRIDSPIDVVRRRYLSQLHNHTGRNVIAYYSGWLNYPKAVPALLINDEDKNAFMSAINGLDRSKGLDLILHTPGGDIAATESLVDYLRKMFGTNIRALVPQLAMSAGTMMACACESFVMGKQSNLGPIDPQLNGLPAKGVIAEFTKALEAIREDSAAIHLWQSIIGKYHPTFLGSCQQAIDWSEQIVKNWLVTGMFRQEENPSALAAKVIKGLSDPESTFSHGRHLHVESLKQMGIKITCMEDNPTLQDLLLTVHHSFMHTFAMSTAIKITENHQGTAMVLHAPKPA